MGSFIRSNAVWNTMVVDKHSVSPQRVVLENNCTRRRQTCTHNIYFSKHKTLLLPWKKWSNALILPPDSRLITPGNDAILWAQCWPLLLADWTLSSGYSQESPDEWKSMLLSPSITSISVTMATMFMSPLGMTAVAEERGWREPTNGSSYRLDSENQSGEHSHIRSHHLERSIHTPSPNFLITNSPIIFLPSP